MNIFVTSPDPVESAQVLPDKHIVKMPLETCQMLAVVYSKWYFNWGNDLLPKKDGTPYNTEKGAFRGHPCTIWAAESIANRMVTFNCSTKHAPVSCTDEKRRIVVNFNYYKSKEIMEKNYIGKK